MSLLAKRLENLHPYVPGEQPRDRDYIKLNANENPYPPHPSVAEAVASAVARHPERLGLYPDPDASALRQAVADMLNATGGVLCRASAEGDVGACAPAPQDALPFAVTPDMVFCGNGSDEVLSFLFYTFFDSDRPLVLPEFTYSFYPVYCGYYGIPLHPVPLRPDWTLDVGAMLDASRSTESGIIFANPNAPTGLALPRAHVADMLAHAPRNRVYVVDEAYCDFGGESCLPLLKDFGNLVVVRTFSKSLSFAGMRLGYAVASPELIASVFTVKNSFNHFPVDVLAQVAGAAACRAAGYYARNARAVAAARDDLAVFLRARGWQVLDSCTNFVFARAPGRSGGEVYQSAKRAGILIRHFATPGIEDFVRITIGTPEQMAAVKEAL